ncbi:MAG: ABC transporter ATP-binding protein [Acidibacillus sp.]|nr:ABC transporter ATP-binding protein [Acidibacillus sp.]
MLENNKTPVLELNQVSIVYETSNGDVQAVNKVSFAIYENEIMALVGESGSGKSTIAYAVMRLLRGSAYLTEGTVKILGRDIYEMNKKDLRTFRWSQVSMVFQSAMSALNPVMNVEQQIVDTILSHEKITRKEASMRAASLLDLVSIDRKHLRSYPHELSGGMRQRVVIAIAIALKPQLVIMDEPTTALDVVVQRSILDQIQEIQREQHFSILFISHDFSLVQELASRIAIMYAGRIVEETTTASLEVLDGHHPYTQGLLRAIPKLTADEIVIEGIPGSPPNLITLPTGCAFHPRCPVALETCKSVKPLTLEHNGALIECHLFDREEENAKWQKEIR